MLNCIELFEGRAALPGEITFFTTLRIQILGIELNRGLAIEIVFGLGHGPFGQHVV